MSKRVEFDKEKAEKLYKDGKNAKEISIEMGVSYQSLLRYLKKVGLHNPVPRKRTNSTSKNKVSKSKKEREITMEEKIAYCDAKYGKGKWYFMTREQFKAELTRCQMIRELEKDLKNKGDN